MAITEKQCDDRHRNSKIVMTAILVLTLVFLTLAIFAIEEAGSASEKAGAASQDFNSHAAAQTVTDTYVKESLQRIEKKIDSMRSEGGLSSDM